MDLFDANNRYSPRAEAIQSELVKAVRKIFKDNPDVSPRVLALLGHHAVTDVELEVVILGRKKV